MELKSTKVDAADFYEAIEMCYERRWTDGLAVIPPTEAKVAEMIEYVARDPQEVIGTVPPKNGIASIEKIAINCVMAGCLPAYMPVVIAAVEAMLEPEFNLNGVQATQHSCAPLTIVGGPIVKELGFNCKDGLFAGGSRANATIGRAIRLILWNIGGGYTGDIDRASFGHPGRYTFCVAENQDANPWEPLHVERGLPPGSNGVTVFACEAPHFIQYGIRNSAANLLMNVADTMASLGTNNIHFMGQTLVIISPGLAPAFAREGWSKRDVKQYLFEHARKPLSLVKRSRDHDPFIPYSHWPKWIDPDDDNQMIPAVAKPEDIIVMVAGGTAGNAVCPGWGIMGGFAVTKPIRLPG